MLKLNFIIKKNFVRKKKLFHKKLYILNLLILYFDHNLQKYFPVINKKIIKLNIFYISVCQQIINNYISKNVKNLIIYNHSTQSINVLLFL